MSATTPDTGQPTREVSTAAASSAAGTSTGSPPRRLGLALYNVAAKGEAFDPKRLFPGKGGRGGATTKPKEAEAAKAGAAAKTKETKGARMN